MDDQVRCEAENDVGLSAVVLLVRGGCLLDETEADFDLGGDGDAGEEGLVVVTVVEEMEVVDVRFVLVRCC